MTHPDTWFDTHHHEHRERIEKNTKNLANHLQDGRKVIVVDKILLLSGNLLIRIGDRLKKAAKRPYHQNPHLAK